MAEKVLIIDDDVQSLRLVGLMLERQGFKIVAANNGIQGLRSARTEQPDIILLDVMMPDMDGYEVARRLRKNPETTLIPIIMFTARSQVEDKVTGYEAGVDDYLTKPIHPAELIAHLKALLSRQKGRTPTGPLANIDKGQMIGVLGAKGGLGVSTLTLNLAIAFYQRAKREVIAIETRSGQGSWSTELAYNNPDGLSNLLSSDVTEITPASVEKELVRVPYGIRLLLASPRCKEVDLMKNTDQMEQLLDTLPLLARMVFVDIGTNSTPGFNQVISHCNEVIVVTEPFPTSVFRTKQLIEDLNSSGFGKSKFMTVVSVNRIRADMQMSILQMQEVLKMPISQVIPPVPEVAYQAASRNVPILQIQANGIFGQQFQNLAQIIAERVPV
jgi:CheY-like chemotaxis protein/MinD-like ATPase involved in chromosome partitioning or flagellar assembly